MKHVLKAIAALAGALVTGEVAAIVQAGGTPGWQAQLPVVLGAAAAGWAAYRLPNKPTTGGVGAGT